MRLFFTTRRLSTSPCDFSGGRRPTRSDVFWLVRAPDGSPGLPYPDVAGRTSAYQSVSHPCQDPGRRDLDSESGTNGAPDLRGYLRAWHEWRADLRLHETLARQQP